MTRNKKNWDYLVDYRGQFQQVLGTGQKGSTGIGVAGQKGEQGDVGQKGEIGVGQKGEIGVGQKGDTASGAFIYKGSIPDASQLPTAGNATGDSWQTADDNSIYAWDGTAWIPLGGANAISVTGDKGAPGADGANGAVGDKGAPGDTGAKGETGVGQKGEPGSLPLISSLPVLP